MAVKKKEVVEEKKTMPMYSKESLISSKAYIHHKDVLNVVLKDGKMYTKEQCDNALEKFLKGKVN